MKLNFSNYLRHGNNVCWFSRDNIEISMHKEGMSKQNESTCPHTAAIARAAAAGWEIISVKQMYSIK